MLPDELKGPGLTIRFSDASDFLQKNKRRFPHLDPEFISQICYEHSHRFDRLFPDFDPDTHATARIVRSAHWIRSHVFYEANRSPEEMRGRQFDKFEAEKWPHSEVSTNLQTQGTWHFAPVMISANVARALGARHKIGDPYELIEGTHRVGYLLRMLERELVEESSQHELIEIVQLNAIKEDSDD